MHACAVQYPASVPGRNMLSHQHHPHPVAAGEQVWCADHGLVPERILDHVVEARHRRRLVARAPEVIQGAGVLAPDLSRPEHPVQRMESVSYPADWTAAARMSTSGISVRARGPQLPPASRIIYQKAWCNKTPSSALGWMPELQSMPLPLLGHCLESSLSFQRDSCKDSKTPPFLTAGRLLLEQARCCDLA